MSSGHQPIAIWALEVPAGDQPTPVISDIPGISIIRLTMAAIDPNAKLLEADQPKRATLKIMRRPLNDDYEDSSDSDEDEDDEEEEEEEEEEKAPRKQNKKAAKKEADAAIKKALATAQKNAEEMEVDGAAEDDSDDSDDSDTFEIEEFVVCTLDPERHYQQTLDLTINEEEEVFFKVIGNYDISLTGNYVVPTGKGPMDDDNYSDDSDEEDYDLSPDEDELMYGNGAESDSEEDELDSIPNPRVTEVDSEEETSKSTKTEKKNLKRAADDSPAKKGEEPEKKLSKKQLKKLKANDGKPVDTTNETPDKKKVQFAKELEQGPSSTEKKGKDKAAAAEKPKAVEPKKTESSGSKKIVQGIAIEDKKTGTGPVAKPGSKLGMRYIGKLQNGKQFDSNTKGKPFTFRLGKGEVIKGWDIGLAGMQVGGERRITIPPQLAYGKKSLPGIPANSTLIFDVKLVEVK